MRAPRPAAPHVLMIDAMFGDYLFQRDGFSAEQLSELRRRAHDRRVCGSLRVMVTEALLWELAGLGVKDPEKYDRVLTTLADLCDDRLLAPRSTRARLELEARSTPSIDALLLRFDRSRHIWWTAARDPQLLEHHARRAKEEKRQHREEQERKLAGTIAGYDEQQAKLVIKDPTLRPWRERLFEDPEGLIDSWTTDDIREFAREHHIRRPTIGWPTPKYARAFRWHKAIHVVRVRGALLQDLSHLNPGLFDLEHLATACAYADTYVTNDRRVLRLAGELSAPTMRALAFDDWGREMLAS